MNRDDFEEQCEIRINIIIDVGDERIYDSYAVGDARYPKQVIDEAEEILGKAERHWIPRSIDEQYEREVELSEEVGEDE